MDYLCIDIDKKINNQFKFIEAYNTVWQIITLTEFKRTLSNNYDEQELSSVFDSNILLNIEKLEEIFSDFYNEFNASDLVDSNTEGYKIIKVLEQIEEELKKKGTYTKEEYDKEVYLRLKDNGFDL
jgi:hypothetical protein